MKLPKQLIMMLGSCYSLYIHSKCEFYSLMQQPQSFDCRLHPFLIQAGQEQIFSALAIVNLFNTVSCKKKNYLKH